MRTIVSRVERLEREVSPPSVDQRVYMLAGGSRGSDCGEFIRAQGYVFDDAHDLAIQMPIVAPSPNGPVDVETPLRLIQTPHDSWKLSPS